MDKMEVEHGISPASAISGDWREGSDLFLAALARLKEKEIRRYEAGQCCAV